MAIYPSNSEKELCNKIKELFYKAINKFLIKDKNMPQNCSERAKVHRVAHYLENYIKKDELFKGYVVDCEYNRYYDDVKRLFANIPRDDNNKHNGTFMSDLIVHKRKTDYNLLYCEFKNKYHYSLDERKVDSATNGESPIQYLLGATIVFKELNIDNYKDKIKWFPKEQDFKN